MKKILIGAMFLMSLMVSSSVMAQDVNKKKCDKTEQCSRPCKCKDCKCVDGKSCEVKPCDNTCNNECPTVCPEECAEQCDGVEFCRKEYANCKPCDRTHKHNKSECCNSTDKK